MAATPVITVVPFSSAKPFLGFELQAARSFLFQCVGGRGAVPLIRDLTSAGHGARDVGGRAEIAACAYRTETGNNGRDMAVQQVEQALDHHRPHRRQTSSQCVGAQQNGRSHHRFGQRLTDAAGEKFQEVALVVGHFVVRYHEAGVAAEAGVYSVNHLTLGEFSLQGCAAALDPAAEIRVGAERHRLAIPGNSNNIAHGKGRIRDG